MEELPLSVSPGHRWWRRSILKKMWGAFIKMREKDPGRAKPTNTYDIPPGGNGK